MNDITNRKKLHPANIILAGVLFLVYTGTYLLSLLFDKPIDLLNYLAAAGTLAGVFLVLHWLPTAYFYTLALFCCVAQYFGMMFDFYALISWYDILLHFSSGIMLGAFGIYLYRLLTRKVTVQLPIAVGVLFAVFFAISCAGLWEIYEYLADTFGGLSAQGVGVQDTMEDIIAGSSSAALYGIGLTLWERRKRKSEV